ncbi:hypothetical protein AB1Y20_003410 [Prymnesium parvum]|uniref:Uncharacterized protein n=1 Tax=Prymnesium parvum TaxID=97485 RepID=A0AB34JAU4_PRYPA
MSWLDSVRRQAQENLAPCGGLGVAPPRIAFCIAGSARSFATPLVTTLHQLNWLDTLAPSMTRDCFLYLKTQDSEKMNYVRPDFAPASYFHAHNDKASQLSALVAALEVLRSRIAEAVIVNGSGSYNGSGWKPSVDRGSPWQAVRASDDDAWKRFQSPRCPIVNRTQHPLDNTEQRLINSLLGMSWCAQAIRRFPILQI